MRSPTSRDEPPPLRAEICPADGKGLMAAVSAVLSPGEVSNGLGAMPRKLERTSRSWSELVCGVQGAEASCAGRGVSGSISESGVLELANSAPSWMAWGSESLSEAGAGEGGTGEPTAQQDLPTSKPAVAAMQRVLPLV